MPSENIRRKTMEIAARVTELDISLSAHTAISTINMVDAINKISDSAIRRMLVVDGPKVLAGIYLATKTPLSKEGTSLVEEDSTIFSSDLGKVGYVLVLNERAQTATIYLGQPTEVTMPDGTIATELQETMLICDNQPLNITKKPIHSRIRGEGDNIVEEYEVLGSKFVPEMAGLEKDMNSTESQINTRAAEDELIKTTGLIETFGISKITLIKEGNKYSAAIIETRVDNNALISETKPNISTNAVRLDPLVKENGETAIGEFDQGSRNFTLRGRIKRPDYNSSIASVSQLPPEITDRYQGQFESTESGAKVVNDVETNVIYGIKEDGTKQVIAMEIEIDGEMRMTGVSETTVLDKDGNPHNIYVYIDPNWNASDPDDDRSLDKKWGRFTVNSDTANILFGKPEDPKAPLFWNALAEQMGVTTDSAIDTVMNKNGGIINFNVPVGERKKITYNSEMTKLPYPVDLDKPVAIRVVFSQADYDRLPNEIKEKRSVITYEQEGEQYGLFDSRLAWTEPNGQLTIYSIYTGYEVFDGLDPLRYGNNGSFLSSEAAKTVSKQIYSIFDLIGDRVQNKVNYYGDSVVKALDADLVKFR